MFYKSWQEIKHLYWGSGLMAGSFLFAYVRPFDFSLNALNLFFVLGNILLFDFLSLNFSGYSLLRTPNRRRHFLLVGAVFGIFFEFYVHWLGKLWYYPLWSVEFYWVSLVPGFALYVFYLLETFLGIKAVLEYFFRHKIQPVSFRGLKVVFEVLALVGASGFIIF